MVIRASAPVAVKREPEYSGLRMDADQYLDLADDGFKYELVDGVMLKSPSPLPNHFAIAGEVFFQLLSHVKATGLGCALYEVDVHFAPNLIYRPDIIYVSQERRSMIENWIEGAPDLIVEVISPSSRALDTLTKRADYERFGVREYWIIDPANKCFTFLRLESLETGSYVEIAPSADTFASRVLPNFHLDLAPIRKLFDEYAPK